jgi:hypothetical protein
MRLALVLILSNRRPRPFGQDDQGFTSNEQQAFRSPRRFIRRYMGLEGVTVQDGVDRFGRSERSRRTLQHDEVEGVQLTNSWSRAQGMCLRIEDVRLQVQSFLWSE